MHHINYSRLNSIQLATGSSQAPKDHHSQASRKATNKGNIETWDADGSITSFLMLEEKVSLKTVRASLLSLQHQGGQKITPTLEGWPPHSVRKNS